PEPRSRGSRRRPECGGARPRGPRPAPAGSRKWECSSSEPAHHHHRAIVTDSSEVAVQNRGDRDWFARDEAAVARQLPPCGKAVGREDRQKRILHLIGHSADTKITASDDAFE